MWRGMICLGLLACQATEEPVDAPTTEQTTTVAERIVPPPTIIDEMPARLVALGDVHGDLKAARRALRLSGLIDFNDVWIGGTTVVVQTGDQIDRGDKEEKILDLFESLGEQAHAAGGAFYSLLGNHEIMNVELDFRYVTEAGWLDFADYPYDPTDEIYAELEEGQQGRAAAFRPGGPWAVTLSDHNVLMVIGDTAFVHGGIHPEHVDYGLTKINNQTRQWMRGERSKPNIMSGDDSPIWSRLYSDDDVPPDCDTLQQTLDMLGIDRMVVGHSVWPEAQQVCDGKVWLIDVGMATAYNGIPMAVEIVDDVVTVLREVE